jgi:glycosyltransferase involved in cell wall biosynthesis
MQGSDLFVMPSQMEEGSPISIIEAMSFGLPVIATDKGDIRDMIAGCGVVLTPEFDGAALSAAIRECMERYADYSRTARRICEQRYGKERFLEDMRNVFFTQRLKSE